MLAGESKVTPVRFTAAIAPSLDAKPPLMSVCAAFKKVPVSTAATAEPVDTKTPKSSSKGSGSRWASALSRSLRFFHYSAGRCVFNAGSPL